MLCGIFPLNRLITKVVQYSECCALFRPIIFLSRFSNLTPPSCRTHWYSDPMDLGECWKRDTQACYVINLRFHSRFSEAIETLLTLALVKRDKASRTFSLHRLVQTSFKYFMTPEQRQRSFDGAVILISNAFPRRDSEVAQLYQMWDRCAVLLQHVLSLKYCFREEAKLNPTFTALQTYCKCNNACQRQVKFLPLLMSSR